MRRAVLLVCLVVAVAVIIVLMARQQGLDLPFVPSREFPVDPLAELPDGYNVHLQVTSPDEKLVAFTGSYNPNDPFGVEVRQAGLWVYDLDTKQVNQLLSGNLKTSFDWSPDSRWVAISKGEGYTREHSLVVIDTKTGRVNDLGIEGVGPAFSPDSKKLAYTGEYDRDVGAWHETGRIEVVDIASGALPEPISPPRQGAVMPRWSPDGTRVSYQVQAPGMSSVKVFPETWYGLVFVAQADGSGAEEVYRYTLDEYLQQLAPVVWEPFGRTLRIHTDEEDLLVAADGSDIHKAVVNPYAVGESIAFSPAFTPYADAVPPERFTVTIENPTDAELETRANWHLPNQAWKIEPREMRFQMPPSGQKTLEFKVRIDDPRLMAGALPTLIVEAPLGKGAESVLIYKNLAGMYDPTIPCVRAGTPPKIDGDLSDWKGARAVWSAYDEAPEGWEPDDISAAVRMMWDDDWLYFGAEIQDDIFAAPRSVRELWQADSVSVMVAGFECTLALIGGEGIALANRSSGNFPISDARVKISHKEGCTIYEAALPMSRVFEMPPEQGEVIPRAGTGTYWHDKDGEAPIETAWQTCRLEFQ
ncbi:MAG: hypothetical protein GTO55_07575 [Armatimonadetes bacterium]|nr:hypothetical protein [Armatimonadota bacterium]NIM24128.1 hypothetical protein [Armatimonadota bacterium]NIM67983.1 hypothetical protein [Armatimonadota bacterium]NIM76487.1 hypothetical protein [Armatimonadota bacterium]NIN06210.1 hypothetical protein [Armatimonadota bacterium]